MASPTASASQPHLANPDLNPSFTKSIFLGELREDMVFPYPRLTPDEDEAQRMILDSFRAWASQHVDRRKHDHDGKFADGVREGMAELGLMGLNIPEEYGGFGASAKVFSKIFGEIGATDGALGVYFGAHQSIGCKGIVLFGTEDQKRRWLPRCASGEIIAGFCLTEPGSGSDAQAMKSTAVPSADGRHYVLNGEKIWISNAGFAGMFTVFAKVPVEEGGKKKQRVTAFIVDAKAQGVRLGKLEEKMGIKASDTRPVFFQDVKVPVEDRLGDVGHGFKIALEVLNSGRLGLSSGAAHGTRAIMHEALVYAKQRQQFGRPIGSFGMIQRKFAQFAAECYAADAGWFVAADMVDRGGVDFSLETACCKVFGSEMVFRAANEALQIAGGIGYSKEYPYEQMVRDARINMIFEGTNEILRALIALMGLQEAGERLESLGNAFKDPLHSMGAIGSYLAGRAKRQVTKPKLERAHAAFEKEADMIADVVHDLGLAVENLMIKHGKKVIDMQFLQERMANTAIDVFLATATLSRASAALEAADGDETKAAIDIDCARIFVPMAMRRARRSVRALTRNQDARLRAMAERALESGELVPEA
ncbi:MAG TPA: acyl-CoA dehydrogenase family protein [Gemmatimonadaceae bacterium]|nr:acyl-CoA dehydrogenase family protein [Gemmatimonadaceae bacterium]